MRKYFSVFAVIAALATSACTQEEIDKFIKGQTKEVPATSISFDKPSYEMYVGETLTLTVTVLPDNTTDKVEWKSLYEDIATVENGVVTAKQEGIASIMATAGDKSAGCRIIVNNKDEGGNGNEGGNGQGDGKIEATEITLNKTEITLVTGLSEQLEVTKILPENANEKTVVWESSNPNVAVVTPRDIVGADGTITQKGGKVTGRDPGQATITALAGVARAECKVTVTSGGSSVTIESITITPNPVSLAINQEQVLTAVITPSGAKAHVDWTFNKQDIVYLGSINDTQAKVQGQSAGTVTVTASAGGKSATCEVTVTGGSATVPVTGITLNKDQLEMTVGQTETLVATISPGNATDKALNWSVMDNRIVAVDANGGLTAKSTGTTKVTVISIMYPEIMASCQVTVKAGSGSGSGSTIEAVDLGLPSGVKWGSMNVGATSPEGYGNFYAWGETEIKSSYSSSNYKFGPVSYSDGIELYRKYDSRLGGDGKSVLEAEDDAATVNVGSGWRMPTHADLKELCEQCTWTWTKQNGVWGMVVSSIANGNSIFLPAAGYMSGTTLYGRGTYGRYWSSKDSGIKDDACALDFISGDKTYPAAIARCSGASIRPVKD